MVDIFCEIALSWLSLELTDDKSVLVQVMTWVSSGNMPLPKPMFTQLYVAIWQHTSPQWVQPSLCESDLIYFTFAFW